MISYSEALRTVLDNVRTDLPTETVPLVLSQGRVLAEDIVATEDIPAEANSAMDGFAVRAEDVTGADAASPVELRIIGEASAGAPFRESVGSGEAVRIMTGGIVPYGADAVIEVESTTEAGEFVHVMRSLQPGASIRKAGDDLRKGEKAISSGKTIVAGDIGVLASLGVTNVPVRVKPKVGILATGNEVVEPHRTPLQGQLRNSSGPALFAACVAAGAEPIDLGIAGDNRDDLEEGLENGLRFDILVTTGGVSAGAYDLVQHLLPEMGVEIRFHKVNIKPGKPILFGLFQPDDRRTLVFGLPGNPVSSLVTFHGFVAPAIRAMLGASPDPIRLTARLEEPYAKRDGRRHSVRGVVRLRPDGVLTVRTTGTQSSGAMSSMSRANCLVIVDEATEHLETGTDVTVELLDRVG